MDQALAALQLGYLSRELRFQVESVWYDDPFKPHRDIAPFLSAIDSCLNALSSNSEQGTKATKLLRQIEKRYDGVCSYMVKVAFKEVKKTDQGQTNGRLRVREIIEEDGGKERLQLDQRQDWAALRNLLQAIVGDQRRLARWFEIGDQLANLRGQLGTRYITQLGQSDLSFLNSSVDQLKFPENREVRLVTDRLIPRGRTPTALVMVVRLKKAYEKLCWLLENRDLFEKPIWNGSTVSYRGRSRRWKRQPKGTQKKEVVAPILDELQERKWPECVDAPNKVKNADASQQLSRFSHTAPIHLWYDGGKIYWGPPKRKRRSARGKALTSD